MHASRLEQTSGIFSSSCITGNDTIVTLLSHSQSGSAAISILQDSNKSINDWRKAGPCSLCSAALISQFIFVSYLAFNCARNYLGKSIRQSWVVWSRSFLTTSETPAYGTKPEFRLLLFDLVIHSFILNFILRCGDFHGMKLKCPQWSFMIHILYPDHSLGCIIVSYRLFG